MRYPDDDGQVMDLVRDGNLEEAKAALGELVLRNDQQVKVTCRWALRKKCLAGRRDLEALLCAYAEDAAQETWLRLWKRRHLWDGNRGRFHCWLARIARRVAITYFRRVQKFTRETPLATDPPEGNGRNLGDHPSRRDLAVLLLEVLRRQPERDVPVLRLRYFDRPTPPLEEEQFAGLMRELDRHLAENPGPSPLPPYSWRSTQELPALRTLTPLALLPSVELAEFLLDGAANPSRTFQEVAARTERGLATVFRTCQEYLRACREELLTRGLGTPQGN
jgi:RNA polymerase sigma factor (sigma-70 family)